MIEAIESHLIASLSEDTEVETVWSWSWPSSPVGCLLCIACDQTPLHIAESGLASMAA